MTQTFDLQQEARLPAGSSKTSMVAQAYQEYCKRRSQGELVDPDAFLLQFPEKRSAIAKLIQAHLFLEENSFLLADASILEAVPFVPPGMVPPRWPELGSEFLGFQLLEELGQGSFAKVYLAADQKLGRRRVALKVGLEGGAEANILGQFEHDNIVPIFSVHEDDASGLTAVCMPFAGRATLADLLDRIRLESKLPTRAKVIVETVRLASQPGDGTSAAPHRLLERGTYVDGIRLLGAQLADGLACIHERGVCHRDLKPSNVLLSPAGVPMLLDFNLSTAPDNPRTRLGGTLPYMAPEQLRAIANPKEGQSTLDFRADIFSLGVVLFELLTGEHPYGPVQLKTLSRQLCSQLLERQQRGPARKPCSVNPAIDRELSDLIERCLAHDADKRPQSAAELARLLHRGLAPLRRVRRLITRYPLAVSAAALLFLATASLGGYALTQLSAPPDRNDAAGAGQEDRSFAGRTAAAESFFKEGKFARAVEAFSQALDIDPHHAATLFARGRAHQQLGSAAAEPNDKNHEFNLALRDFDQANKHAPNGLYLACMGYCCQLIGGAGNGVAELYYQDALKTGFTTAEVANNLGCFLRQRADAGTAEQKRERLEKSLALLDTAVSLDTEGKLQAVYLNRGKVLIILLEQRMHLLQAWKKNTSDTAPAARKKVADEIEDLFERAIRDYAVAEKLGPRSGLVDFDMALLYRHVLLVRFDRDRQVDRDRAERCLHHLSAAIEQGVDLRSGKNRVIFEQVLGDDARFQKLLDAPAPRVSPAPVSLLVDPCRELAR